MVLRPIIPVAVARSAVVAVVIAHVFTAVLHAILHVVAAILHALMHVVAHVFAAVPHIVPHVFAAVPAACMPVATPIALEDPAVPAAVADDPAPVAPEEPLAAIDAVVKRLVHPDAIDEHGLAEARIAAAPGMVEGKSGIAAIASADAVSAVEGGTGHTDADAHADSGRSRRRGDQAAAQGGAAQCGQADRKLT